MIKVKGALLAAITIVVPLSVYAVVSFFGAYPEATPVGTWVFVAVGFAVWAIFAVVIVRMRDED
jgi:hypothetical protein